MNANVLVKSPLLQKIAGYVNRMLKVFGVLDNDSMEMISRPFGKEQSESVDKMELLAPYLDCLTQFRDQIRLMARQSKHTDYLEICDSLRDERLPVLGVRLEDKADESVWKLVDPQELQEEIRRKLADQLKKKREKIISTISSRQKNLQILEKGLLEPSSVFDEDGDSYSIFDDQGIPTHDKEGNELPKKARKKLQSRFEKQKVAYTKASEKLRENPSVLDDLKREISELESQLKSIQE